MVEMAVLDPQVRPLLEDRGVEFVEEEPDSPDPARWAAFQLRDDTLFVLAQYYGRGERSFQLLARWGIGTPIEQCHRFATAFDVDASLFVHIAKDWPPLEYP